MSKALTGVRADNKYSYRILETHASYVREQLKFAPDAAIDPLRLFEDLHEKRFDIPLADMRGFRGSTLPNSVAGACPLAVGWRDELKLGHI